MLCDYGDFYFVDDCFVDYFGDGDVFFLFEDWYCWYMDRCGFGVCGVGYFVCYYYCDGDFGGF